MNSTSLDAGSGTINEEPSLPQISLNSGGVINEQRTTNPSLPPPTAEKEQFSCAEILAGMQVAKED